MTLNNNNVLVKCSSGFGVVASSQKQATDIGLQILSTGGNAVEASIAIAAALNVLEPCSTGIGGDCFALVYRAASKCVEAVNGSGCSSKQLDVGKVCARYPRRAHVPYYDADAITVPGAVACWFDMFQRYKSGNLAFSDLLQPAIKLAENGYKVAPVTAHLWNLEAGKLRRASSNNDSEMLTGQGRAPLTGETMCLPNLAKSLRLIATHGKDVFYKGEIAKAIIATVQNKGGSLTLEDLEAHETLFSTAISTLYHGLKVHECPPNSHGVVVILALEIIKSYKSTHTLHTKADNLHLTVEALRIAFHIALKHVSGDATCLTKLETILESSIISEYASLISMSSTTILPSTCLKKGSDTVYFSVVDKDGNGCSFMNSNYSGFGTGIIPPTYGFTLHNRGSNFDLLSASSDCGNGLKAGTRPYHTLTPGLVTDEESGNLKMVFGCMGAFMQPQAQLQLFLHMTDGHLDPQEALKMPRFCLSVPSVDSDNEEWKLLFEEGFDAGLIDELKRRGNLSEIVRGLERIVFGRGQIIQVTSDGGLSAGSDDRADGSAKCQS